MSFYIGVWPCFLPDIYLQDPIKDYYLPMKNLVNWFSEDVVNRKREDIQKLLLRLLEKSNVNIESLNLPKLTFCGNHSESETQVCSTVHLFTEFLFTYLCNFMNIQSTCSYAQCWIASLIYPSVMGKRSRHLRSREVFDLLLNIMLHCLFTHICKVANIAVNLSICLPTFNSLPPIGSVFIKFYPWRRGGLKICQGSSGLVNIGLK